MNRSSRGPLLLKANTEYADILTPFVPDLYRVINHPVVKTRLQAASGAYLAQHGDGGRGLGNAGQVCPEI